MEYKILNEYEGFAWIADRYETHPKSLEEAVNLLLANGWELVGGVSSCDPGRMSYLVQAMLKRF